MKNPDYSASLTLSKGGKQLINLVTSTAFSSFLVVIIKQLTDKDFSVDSIKNVIDHIAGTVVIVTPVVSTGIKMITNYLKHFKK